MAPIVRENTIELHQRACSWIPIPIPILLALGRSRAVPTSVVLKNCAIFNLRKQSAACTELKGRLDAPVSSEAAEKENATRLPKSLMTLHICGHECAELKCSWIHLHHPRPQKN